MVEKPTNYIVLKNSEVSQLVDRASCQTKGEGGEKLSKERFQIYCGLSRRIIQRNLSLIKQQRKVRPLFQNQEPLRPLRASKVQKRHGEDLVSMTSMPATIDGDTYKYIMSLIDIFIRFLFSLPLETKETSEVEQFSFAFHMYDAKSLDHCITFDDQYMIVLYNFKTTSDIKHSYILKTI